MGMNDRIEKPRKSKGTAAAGEVSYDAAFRGFINVTLTEEQKANFDDWAQSASFWEQFDAQVADGVNVSVKVDAAAHGYVASATQRRTTSPNAGLCVTARAKTPQIALGRLLFTLAILTRKPKWEDTQPLADPDRW